MTVGLPRVLRVVPWLLLPAVAMAQQAPPDTSATPDGDATKPSAPAEDPADKQARDLYRRGDRAYAEGAYEAALRDFSEAYRLSGRSALLFNMANAHERLGQFKEALSALERYLPDAGSREALVRKRIKGLQARIRKIEKKRREEERRRQEQNAAAATPKDEPVSQPWLGYGLLGVGAVGVGLGTYFALSASSARQDADELCAGDPPVCPREAEDAVSRDDRNSVFADVGWGVGLTAAAVGLYLVITHDPKPEKAVSSPVAVVPGGKQGTRIVFSGAF